MIRIQHAQSSAYILQPKTRSPAQHYPPILDTVDQFERQYVPLDMEVQADPAFFQLLARPMLDTVLYERQQQQRRNTLFVDIARKTHRQIQPFPKAELLQRDIG